MRALARVAEERRGDAPLHVVTPIAVDDLPAGAETVRAIPAAPHFAGAAGIVSAAGFNTVRELAPYRERHVCVPFDRRLDDQHARASGGCAASPRSAAGSPAPSTSKNSAWRSPICWT